MANEMIYSNKYEIGTPICVYTISGIYKGEYDDNGSIKYRITFILGSGQKQVWQFINKIDRDTAYNNIILNYGFIVD